MVGHDSQVLLRTEGLDGLIVLNVKCQLGRVLFAYGSSCKLPAVFETYVVNPVPHNDAVWHITLKSPRLSYKDNPNA